MEVCSDQTWRVVSSSGWGLQDAQVVCRQLGHQTEGKRVECNKLTACTHGAHCSGVEFYTNSSFGKPNRSVLLTEVQCSGSEVNLINCSSNELSYENGSELVMQVDVAGVSCNLLTSIIPSTTQTPSTQPSTVMPAVCPTIECPASTMPADCPTTQCPDPTMLPDCPTTQCPVQIMPTDCPTTQCPDPTVNAEILATLCPTAQVPDHLQASNSMAAELGNTVQALYALAVVAAVFVVLSAILGIR